jgi:hypothetical protein
MSNLDTKHWTKVHLCIGGGRPCGYGGKRVGVSNRSNRVVVAVLVQDKDQAALVRIGGNTVIPAVCNPRIVGELAH